LRHVQNFPRVWPRTRNVLVVPDGPKSRKQLDRNIKDEVGAAVIALLLCEKSIANGLKLRREGPARFKVPDVLLGVVENRPSLYAVRPTAGITVHHGFVGVTSNQRRAF